MRIIKILALCILVIILSVIAESVLPQDLMAVISNFNGEYDHTASAEFLREYGWEISPEPIETAEIIIPTEFDEVYENYNSLQLSQGFDLSKHKGERVTRYTYGIINFPNVENARANLLICKHRVIGGDVCTVDADGFMHGFEAHKCNV